ncbi:putative RNA methylase [Parabacteroides sp. PF5-6]|nr:putative RNA methylase [Parabacteroides sp. PF5-6]
MLYFVIFNFSVFPSLADKYNNNLKRNAIWHKKRLRRIEIFLFLAGLEGKHG